MGGLLAAVGFLTTVPLWERVTRRTDALAARAVGWFPVVATALAALLGAIAWGAAWLVPTPAAAAVTVAAWVVLTGALHLDGLADTADAAFAPVARERRLEILRDVHHGTFAVVALGLVLLLKWSALASLGGKDAAAGIALAVVVSRCALLPALALVPPARPDGMAAAIRPGGTPAIVAMGLGIAAAAGFVCFGLEGVALTGGSVALVVVGGAWLSTRFGGLTGDLCGALVEVSEAAVLLAAVALLDHGWIQRGSWGAFG